MERRTLLVVVLAMAFLIGYQLVVVKLYPPPATPPPTATPPPPVVTPAAPAAELAAPPARQATPDHRRALTSATLEADVSSDGGTLDHIRLNRYRDPDTQRPVVLAQSTDATLRTGFLVQLAVDGTALQEPHYTLSEYGDDAVQAEAAVAGLQLTKRYRAAERLIEGTFRLTNVSTRPLVVEYALLVSGPLALSSNGDLLHTQGLTVAEPKVKRTPAGKALKRPVQFTGPHAVAGQMSRYFALVGSWTPPAEQIVLTANKDNGLQVVARWQPVTLSPGQSATIECQWYAGPRDYRQILAASPMIATLFPQGLLGTLGMGLLEVLRFFYRLTHNYGVAIILLTILVGAVLFPLTWMNLRMSRAAMAQMQVIQPKLERLKEQYKKDGQKLNREMMELYKKHNINPLSQLGGCLPLLLQMPIFIALYNTINNSVELRGERFLWIKDLAAPDRALVVGGFPINVLPLLMMGAMFVQMKLSPTKPAASTPGMPNMSTMMTLMFGIMFYSMPSGLVLYWLTNTVIMSGLYLAMRPPASAPT